MTEGRVLRKSIPAHLIVGLFDQAGRKGVLQCCQGVPFGLPEDPSQNGQFERP